MSDGALSEALELVVAFNLELPNLIGGLRYALIPTSLNSN